MFTFKTKKCLLNCCTKSKVCFRFLKRQIKDATAANAAAQTMEKRKPNSKRKLRHTEAPYEL